MILEVAWTSFVLFPTSLSKVLYGPTAGTQKITVLHLCRLPSVSQDWDCCHGGTANDYTIHRSVLRGGVWSLGIISHLEPERGISCFRFSSAALDRRPERMLRSSASRRPSDAPLLWPRFVSTFETGFGFWLTAGWTNRRACPSAPSQK